MTSYKQIQRKSGERKALRPMHCRQLESSANFNDTFNAPY
jgi:hypothetical protein